MIDLDLPVNEGALYDRLQERFGVGAFDEADGRTPWWKARALEIGKLKRLMKSRRLTIEDLMIAAWYADRDGRSITEVWQLARIVLEARREFRKANMTPASRTALEAASAEAHARGELGWAARLYNSDAASAETVLGLWAEHRARAR